MIWGSLILGIRCQTNANNFKHPGIKWSAQIEHVPIAFRKNKLQHKHLFYIQVNYKKIFIFHNSYNKVNEKGMLNYEMTQWGKRGVNNYFYFSGKQSINNNHNLNQASYANQFHTPYKIQLQPKWWSESSNIAKGHNIHHVYKNQP